MNKYIHNIILAIIIGFFIWILLLYSNIVQESFLGASAAMQAAQDAKKKHYITKSKTR